MQMQQSKRKCLQMAVGVTPSVGVYRNSKEAATNHYQRKQKLKTKTRCVSTSLLMCCLQVEIIGYNIMLVCMHISKMKLISPSTVVLGI